MQESPKKDGGNQTTGNSGMYFGYLALHRLCLRFQDDNFLWISQKLCWSLSVNEHFFFCSWQPLCPGLAHSVLWMKTRLGMMKKNEGKKEEETVTNDGSGQTLTIQKTDSCKLEVIRGLV